MKYFAHGNFWLFFGQIIPTAVGMILTIAFANLLSQEAFGTYKYILSLAGFLGAFTLSGIWTSLLRDVAQGRDGVLRPAFRLTLKWSLLASAGALVIGLYYLIKGNALLGISGITIAVATPLLNASSIHQAFVSGKKDFKQFANNRVIQSVVSVTAMIITLLLTQNLLIIILVYFSISVFMSMSLYQFTLKKYKPKDTKIPEESIRYAKHLSLMGILSRFADNLDQLLMWHFVGPAQLAIYTFAKKPVTELQNVIGNIFPLLLPKFAEKDPVEIKKTIPLRVGQSLLFVIPVIIGYIWFAPLFFKFLFPQYMEAVWYSQILVLMLIFFPKGFMGSILTAHAKIKEQYVLNVVGSLTKIIILFVLLPKFGILGAIIAIIGHEFIYTLMLIILFFKKDNDTK